MRDTTLIEQDGGAIIRDISDPDTYCKPDCGEHQIGNNRKQELNEKETKDNIRMQNSIGEEVLSVKVYYTSKIDEIRILDKKTGKEFEEMTENEEQLSDEKSIKIEAMIKELHAVAFELEELKWTNLMNAGMLAKLESCITENMKELNCIIQFIICKKIAAKDIDRT